MNWNCFDRKESSAGGTKDGVHSTGGLSDSVPLLVIVEPVDFELHSVPDEPASSEKGILLAVEGGS